MSRKIQPPPCASDSDPGNTPNYSSVFRLAPPGSTLYFDKATNWCTAMAKNNGRKVKTEKVTAVHHRRGDHLLVTGVTFMDAVRPERPAKALPQIDTRQLSLPDVGAAA
jgi:hypothetical protein